MTKLVYLFLFLILSSFSFSQTASELVRFSPEGKEVAIPYFKEGLYLLHAFEYDEALEKFKTAQLMDPDFVMAYWGEAMCYDRPLANRHEVKKGRAALLKLGLFPEDRIAMAQNDIEKGLIASVEKLYEEGESEEHRRKTYHATLKALNTRFPDHSEVGSFYALSILSNACSEENYLNNAAEVCNHVLTIDKTHPGALHYLIHAYDTPSRADSGLETAHNYQRIAPETELAQHIPSHIFAGIGLWDQSASANEKSWELTESKVIKNKLSLEERAYHSLWWLMYSNLQKGLYKSSEQSVKDMYQDARLSKSKKTRFHALAMRAYYLIESENWASPVSNYDIPSSEIHILIRANDHLAKGLKAYYENNGRRLEWIIGQLEDLRTMTNPDLPENSTVSSCHLTRLIHRGNSKQDLQLVEAMELELRALLSLSIDDQQNAIKHLQKAVELSNAVSPRTGPPAIAKPVHELFGEVMNSIGNHQEALDHFNQSLKIYPNRTRSLLGAYHAHQSLGNTDEALRVKKMILKNWHEADPEMSGNL